MIEVRDVRGFFSWLNLRFGLFSGALTVSFHEGNFKSPFGVATVDGSENLKRTT